MFGSKKNILLGSCGGLKHGAKSLDIIIPEWSYAEESSAKAYQPQANNKYHADETLSDKLANKLSETYTVHRGSTITYQAMLGETWEDITKWSREGYAGVEMEAATVFATSNHFQVPSAAILRIGDNLIEEETVLDINYENSRDLRRNVSKDTFNVALRELIG
jgi:purine-nucleoside phosphorylase